MVSGSNEQYWVEEGEAIEVPGQANHRSPSAAGN
jgi:hypothetical protein